MTDYIQLAKDKLKKEFDEALVKTIKLELQQQEIIKARIEKEEKKLKESDDKINELQSATMDTHVVSNFVSYNGELSDTVIKKTDVVTGR